MSVFKPDYCARTITAWPLFPWKELHNIAKDPREKLVIAGKIRKAR